MSNQHKIWTEELESKEKFNDFAKYEHALHIHNEKYLNMQRINSQIIHRGKDLIQVCSFIFSYFTLRLSLSPHTFLMGLKWISARELLPQTKQCGYQSYVLYGILRGGGLNM